MAPARGGRRHGLQQCAQARLRPGGGSLPRLAPGPAVLRPHAEARGRPGGAPLRALLGRSRADRPAPRLHGVRGHHGQAGVHSRAEGGEQGACGRRQLRRVQPQARRHVAGGGGVQHGGCRAAPAVHRCGAQVSKRAHRPGCGVAPGLLPSHQARGALPGCGRQPGAAAGAEARGRRSIPPRRPRVDRSDRGGGLPPAGGPGVGPPRGGLHRGGRRPKQQVGGHPREAARGARQAVAERGGGVWGRTPGARRGARGEGVRWAGE
mmetsp:Transcript_20278/g.64531  ORF Transcript_20278/g.64531 Transcript_20278/m.64531 type:complete len:264 (-) Transcript_20278:64-855(-)